MSADWQAIQREYEQGIPLRDIVAAHGSSIATISRVARHEGWIRPVKPLETRNVKQVKHETPMPPTSVSMPMDAISIARIGLKQLAQHLQGEATEDILPIPSHKSLSDALAQYVKVLLTIPQNEEESSGMYLDLRQLPTWKRTALRRLLETDEPEGEAI